MAVREAQATGYVEAGQLYIRQDRWPLRDGEVVITVHKAYATRSIHQNKWYWGSIVKLVADHTGYTPDEVHELYKAKFLPRIMEIPGPKGQVVAEFTMGGSTRELNRVEFGEYCEAIREWAASELEVLIPDPDPELRT